LSAAARRALSVRVKEASAVAAPQMPELDEEQAPAAREPNRSRCGNRKMQQ
jgi:hypothetical protein